jgi:hypothetical protein
MHSEADLVNFVNVVLKSPSYYPEGYNRFIEYGLYDKYAVPLAY